MENDSVSRRTRASYHKCYCNPQRKPQVKPRSNNDPEKAKNFHQILMDYMSPTRPQKPSMPGNIFTPQPIYSSSDTDSNPADQELSNTLTAEKTAMPSKATSKSATPSDIDRSSFTEPTNVGLTTSESRAFELPDGSRGESSLPAINELDISQNLPTSLKSSTEEDESEWDFILPSVPPPSNLTPGMGLLDAFSLHDIVGAMQHGASLQTVQNYLGYYDENIVRKNINGTVCGFPAMFFVVATNNPAILQTWVTYGGDVAAIYEGSKVPLLAFAIIQSEIIQMDTTLLVATLLSLGASPQVIPRAFYAPYCQDLPEDGPDDENLAEDINEDDKKWCTNAVRAKLAKTANLTQRYHLDRAAKMKNLSKRYKQVALRRKAEALLGIPYFLIGQTMAVNLLLQKLLSYMLLVPTCTQRKPLVLVFAGPSGHGKTELARRLGSLLSLELEVVDCTIFNREMELFGPRKPYIGAERGSPLNNFLARNAGQKCIVFLDEFEKTTSDIHKALLLPFDNGEYQDRRNLAKIDCSNTIWILATNAMDSTIKNFCSKHRETIFLHDDQSVHAPLMKQLSREIKEDFRSQFDSPLTGRISAFIPFLPFSPGEQAVVTHKYLLELSRKVRTPINLSVGHDERLLGNIRLHVRKDSSVCRTLAEAEYSPDL
ncbi:P-loop containing nucleoside triphosphate hydrolase protein [Elaphomyces granulatus]